MGAAAPWSVKGIDPKAREVAKELARRSGMTLGEWLNRIILEDDMPEEIASEDQISARPARAMFETPAIEMPGPRISERTDDLGRIALALDQLTDRIEASETRTGLAVAGVEHSVRHAMARIETAEREHLSVATRFDAAAERIEAEQARAAERLRRIESEGPRSAEALKLLEARIGQAETAAPNSAALIEEVVARLGERLADAEAHTGAALESLRGSLSELDQRLRAAGGGHSDLEQRLESLAQDLTRQVEAARDDMAERLATTPGSEVEARLDRLALDLAAAEQRSARAIETMGREVLSMADTLSRRVRSTEQRSAEAIEQVGGEIARIAGAVEARLSRTDQLHAEALERLGSEIGRITERLTDRILQSERRAAQAIEDVGEQVAKVTERMEERHERASGDVAERLRASEERVARLLEQALARIDASLAGPAFSRAADEDEALDPSRDPNAPLATAAFAAELFSRAEPLAHPALDPAHPAFGAEDFEAAETFAPLDASAEAQLEPEGIVGETPERPALSTREVIEQARAAAREAAAAAARSPSIQAGERRPRPARGSSLFGGFGRARPGSAWQTALMVAGGAAFLSVGAAGVVLIEGAPMPRQPDSQLFSLPPRIALALSPSSRTPSGSQAAALAPPSVPAAPEAATSAFISAVRGVERHEPGALAKVKGLAESGLAPAQVFLARLYETGQGGVVQNVREARRWTERAAEGGDPAAMHNLALFYFRGEGGPQDSAAAARWFKDAAEHGVVDSQYNLGLLYQSGSGVPRDLTQAYKWFSIAANAGDGEARTAALDLQRRLPPGQLAAADSQASGFAATGDTASTRASLAVAQKVLGRLGYYKGKPDGAASHELSLAVAAYQRDQGLAATGALDRATVTRLSVFNR